MLSRRSILPLAVAGVCGTGGLMTAMPARAGLRLADDGLYHLDWYLDSFLDVAEDIESARQRGKRLAILWSLRGCPGCRTLHEVYLKDPAVEGFIRDHFDVMHLNILGLREVTDVDRTLRPEKSFATAYGVQGTPTFQFMPQTADRLAAKSPQDREVLRMEGLPDRKVFLAMFRFVVKGGSGKDAFTGWMKTAGEET